MKKFMLVSAFAVTTMGSFAQTTATNLLFDKYAGKPGFTTVDISEKLFQLIASATRDTEADLYESVGEISGVKILVYEDTLNTANIKELYNEAEMLIPAGMEELMNIDSEGDKVRLFVRESFENIIEHLFMLVGSTEEFVLIDIFGKINLSKLSKISDTIDIEGFDNLKKIEDK